MRVKSLAILCLPLLLLTAIAVRAGEKAAENPTVVVRFQSLNALLQNLNLVVKLVGQEEAANQIEGLVKSKIGKQGLEGIDTSRPFGAYVRFGKDIDDITGAILIPMIDQKTFLTLLENLNVAVTKDKDDIYTHKTNKNFNLYFRFAHEYMFVTSVNTESIEKKNLLDPAKALAISGDSTISLVAHLDQIPSAAKSIALAQLDEKIQAAQSKDEPNETKTQKLFRIALLREANKFGTRIVREASEVRFDIDVSDKTKELKVNLTAKALPGSDLAKMIEAVGDLKSPLANVGGKNAAFHGALHVSLPDALKNAFGKVLDEAAEMSLANIQDAQKKKQAETLFQALMPTAKSGEFQAVAAVLGPKGKHYTFVGALQLKDGEKLGKTIHDLLKDSLNDLPANVREKITLDFDSVGSVKIHRFEIPKDANVDKMVDQVTGDNLLYVAFRDDALFVALGKESLATLKTVVANKTPGTSQPLVFDFDVARMAPLMAQTDEQKELASKLFADGKNGRVRLSVNGGSSLAAQLQMRLNVLEFLVKLKNDKER